MNATPATPFTGLGKRISRTRGLISPDEGDSAAARLRNALRDNGPLSAGALRELLGLASVSLVGALLKHDLHTGRVKFSGGAYRIDLEFDERAHGDIRDAIAYLKRNGYEVRKVSV